MALLVSPWGRLAKAQTCSEELDVVLVGAQVGPDRRPACQGSGGAGFRGVQPQYELLPEPGAQQVCGRQGQRTLMDLGLWEGNAPAGKGMTPQRSWARKNCDVLIANEQQAFSAAADRETREISRSALQHQFRPPAPWAAA